MRKPVARSLPSDYFASMPNRTPVAHTEITSRPLLRRRAARGTGPTPPVDTAAASAQLALAQIEALIAEARSTLEQLEQAERTLAVAVRGTPAVTPDLKKRLVEYLRASDAQPETALFKAFPETNPDLRAALAELESELLVGNVGTAATPVWVAVPGFRADVRTRYEIIYRAIRTEPRTLAELQRLSGGTPGQTSGAIVALQRTELGRFLENHGEPRRARWFLRAP